MSDATDERPWPGDWIVWVQECDGPHLGRLVGSLEDRRFSEHERRFYRAQPSSTDRRRDLVDPSSITTLIRTGEEGEGEKIVALLQHERPDIREIALQAIAEHTGERWRPPTRWNNTSVRNSIGGWRGDDDA